MKYDKKSDKAIRAYLLGLLPEDEATALEEEYFVDRQSFHRLQSEESALIVDYLDRHLHGRENEIFESRYLHVPELQRKVEDVRQQRLAVKSSTRPFTWLRWGLALAVLVLLLGGGIWIRHFLRKQPDSTSRSQLVNEKSISPVPPPQESSVAHEHEPTPPSINSQRKNRPTPTVRSREGHLAAGVQPLNQTRPPEAATPTPVETTAINSDPRNGTGSAPAASVSRIKRVAVLDFDYGTVQSYVSSIYGTNQDVGKGITDMLVEKLVKDGKYSVIERKALDKILAEQNFSNSDRANPATAQKIGQILGVDAIIMGSITKFGRDDKSKAIGGAGLSTHGFGIGGIKRNEAKAVCAISARLVDTTTGEILAAVTGEGESKRSGTSLLGAGGGGGEAGGGVFDTHASNFGQTLLGEAVTQAVSEVDSQFNAGTVGRASRNVEVSGFVTRVDGLTLFVNIGSKAGLKVGDVLDILRPGRTIQNSASGKVLAIPALRLGIATVTEVDTEGATATFKGSLPPKIGDVARMPN